MTNRILDFAESSAVLSLRDGLMVISRSGTEERIPVKDIAVVVASHRHVTFTQGLVAELGKEGGMLICCDRRHHPVAMMLPLEHHHLQSERFQRQAGATLPVKKRIWKEIVRAKIAAQSRALSVLGFEDGGLLQLSRKVKSGDVGNLEAVASQRYWPRLFADRSFRRRNELDGRNALLNYGYAVVRAIAARAVCAAGLHPALGVHHKNRANAFCLADDLMEPCRPLIDETIARFCRESDPREWRPGRHQKERLLECCISRYRVDGELRTLFDILTRESQQLGAALTGESRDFRFADINTAI